MTVMVQLTALVETLLLKKIFILTPLTSNRETSLLSNTTTFNLVLPTKA
jgi:hypothetical protein